MYLHVDMNFAQYSFAFQFDGIYTCNKELPFELIRAYASSLF